MWPNPQFAADVVTFTEEILNGKLHFLSRVFLMIYSKQSWIFDVECNPPDKSNFPFHIGADISNSWFLYYFFIFFLCLVYSNIWESNIFIIPFYLYFMGNSLDVLLFSETINVVSFLDYTLIEFIILLFTFSGISFARNKDNIIWWT